jgi:hypothetical protein
MLSLQSNDCPTQLDALLKKSISGSRPVVTPSTPMQLLYGPANIFPYILLQFHVVEGIGYIFIFYKEKSSLVF